MPKLLKEIVILRYVSRILTSARAILCLETFLMAHIHVPCRFHDDVELTEDELHKFTLETKDVDDGLKECTYTLTIPSGHHKDTGQYRFTAKNKFGKDECSVSDLRGHFRPVITAIPRVDLLLLQFQFRCL